MFNYYYYTNSYYMLGNILVLVGVALMALAQMKVSRLIINIQRFKIADI